MKNDNKSGKVDGYGTQIGKSEKVGRSTIIQVCTYMPCSSSYIPYCKEEKPSHEQKGSNVSAALIPRMLRVFFCLFFLKR